MAKDRLSFNKDPLRQLIVNGKTSSTIKYGVSPVKVDLGRFLARSEVEETNTILRFYPVKDTESESGAGLKMITRVGLRVNLSFFTSIS